MQGKAKVKVYCTFNRLVEGTEHIFHEGQTVRDVILSMFPSEYPAGRIFTLDGKDLPIDYKLESDQVYIFPFESVREFRDVVLVSGKRTDAATRMCVFIRKLTNKKKCFYNFPRHKICGRRFLVWRNLIFLAGLFLWESRKVVTKMMMPLMRVIHSFELSFPSLA